MNDFGEIKKSILDTDITLIVCDSLFRTFTILNLLNELAIKDNIKTFLFTYNISSEYYLRKLISFLSGIDYKLVTHYFYPHIGLSKNLTEKIDAQKYVETIEMVQKSSLIMSGKKAFVDEDDIDYLVDMQADILIISDFNAHQNNTKYDFDETLRKIKEKVGQNIKHIVLIQTAIKPDDGQIVSKFKNYVSSFVFGKVTNHIQHKDININILNAKTEKSFSLEVDKNYRIIERENENE